MMRALVIAIPGLIFLLAAGSDASGRFDEGLGGAVLLSRPTAGDCLELPGLTLEQSGGAVDLGLTRPFELSELDTRFVNLAWRRGRSGVAIGVSHFGQSDLFSETKFDGALGVRWRRWSFGVAGRSLLAQFGGDYDQIWTWALDVGATFRSGRLLLAAAVQDVKSPSLSERVDAEPPHLSVYGELMGAGSFSTLGRATVQSGCTPQFGLGQVIFVSDYAWLMWSLTTAPTKYGGGLQVRRGSLKVSWVTSYHPDLGYSYTASVGFDFLSDRY